MPSQICQGKRLWDPSVFTSHKSFTFGFPTLQECLMGGFLSCSKWVGCECSITPVFVPTRSRKPLTEIYEFKFNVDTRAIERAMFDQKVWFNSHCLWMCCFWKMVKQQWPGDLNYWQGDLKLWISIVTGHRETQSVQALSWRIWSCKKGMVVSFCWNIWGETTAIDKLYITSTLDSIIFAKHATSHFMQAEEEKFIKAMRREMVPIARPMPQFPPPFVPQRY